MLPEKDIIISVDKESKHEVGRIRHKEVPTRKKFLSSKAQNNQTSVYSSKKIDKPEDGDVESQKVKERKRRRRRRRKKHNSNSEADESFRLQKRTRYLLIKMKLEQNLIDAYSGEGWKGQSREKIKPNRELQRASKQILKCKLGIREAIRQLHLLSAVGSIEDSAIAPDGSVHHENIICAKCKLREAFPDNDIILCDGTCNCGFHQKCLQPPLLTENIPPGDQGWFCRLCECKMEILETVNAHLGTRFPLDSAWQDIFKEEASLSEGGDALQNSEQEWPSDDPEDDDYDPEKIASSGSCSRLGSEAGDSDDGNSFCSLGSFQGKALVESERETERSNRSQKMFDSVIHEDSDQTAVGDLVTGPRQRRAVDYKKLYDEMFGKDAPINDMMSEDEDWGPTKKIRREKESDAANTLVTLSGSNRKLPILNSEDGKEICTEEKARRSFLRIPPDAVQKLRMVFADNELPSKAVKEVLSKQLGLESEKVNKWFKNARYMALKSRNCDQTDELQKSNPELNEDYRCRTEEEDKTNHPLVICDIPSATAVHSICIHSPTDSPKSKGDKNSSMSITDETKVDVNIGNDVSLKPLKSFSKGKKKIDTNVNCKEQEDAEAQLERVCKMKGKVEALEQVLFGMPYLITSDKAQVSKEKQHNIIYLPVTELKEKD
ncbi:pathogenesis-related homeodomain protein [Impatiens glandulifera]|uniref:pathogenesis-related homeodomain protein n=1 Tax=Impatiens glandulifera TaxID=253017 RepID=UPI001FB14261|nr:pathogenesis-related homeodomain protein [Impatiens glandulifera]XP_047334595.1 pathogenesis-related homeodomain protein [Impatiens glandulifera]